VTMEERDHVPTRGWVTGSWDWVTGSWGSVIDCSTAPSRRASAELFHSACSTFNSLVGNQEVLDLMIHLGVDKHDTSNTDNLLSISHGHPVRQTGV
jgi:hypothetical protein